jgi:hypothetical protein
VGGGQDGLDETLVAGAAAQVGGDELAGLVLGQLVAFALGFGQVGLGEHEEAGRAEPALQRVMIAERLLQVRQLLAIGETLHRADLRPVGLDAEDQAGPDRGVVQDHRAGPADTVLAAQVRAGVAKVVAEHVGQRPASLDHQVVVAAVDLDRDRMRIGHGASRRLSTAWLSTALTSCGSTGM